MNIDEVTGMPALPENQFWRIVPGHWDFQETMLVRLMKKVPGTTRTSGFFVTREVPCEYEVVEYQAPLMVPERYTESFGGRKNYDYGVRLEPTPENFRLVAQHVLDNKPYSLVGDHFGQKMRSAELYNNQYKGDYPPRSMR